ncbi:PREDICTED: serine/arginine-rich splicing factor 7-like isoform X2 [Nicrophorus vespilloides]|uniref:Serine/arginine-rich splicing factor 7-like isoform X2 n=1 Tax=Nicrophorus vespilloides TaxID=110193 RepID=A0ABM1MK83_NICVS|nr:PREDICTED: serine/arginine-rich splicing factor 7-like isoform X2 [Nicrophorus vespilloides]
MRGNEQGSPRGHRSRSCSRSMSKSSRGSKKSGQRSSYTKSRSRSRSRSSSQEFDGYRLHIADIGENIRKSDLEKLFSSYGTLREIWMTNSTPCFGFAVYKDKKDAATALTETDGVEVAGSRIRVSYAKPRTRGSGRRFFNPNMRCYQCGYTGHFYRDCPDMNGGGDKRGGGSRLMAFWHSLYGLVKHNNGLCYGIG